MIGRSAVLWVLMLTLALLQALPAAAQLNDEAVPYVVRYHALPSGVRPGQLIHGARVERVDATLGFARVRTHSAAGLLRSAAADPLVRSVTPDPPLKLLLHEPDDPRWAEQYGPRQIRAPQAWATTVGSGDAAVCVVDTGVRYTHEDLAGARWLGGWDFVNNDGDPDDDHGHGTHVAGIAAATIDNGTGIAGVAQAGLYGVKVLDRWGFGAWSNVASGITWCADHAGPRAVINLSLGGSASSLVKDALAYAAGKGALVVAAAGNSGPCTDCIVYPAAYPEAVAVTCTDAAETQCTFSSEGPQAELAAPGHAILSTHHTADDAYALMSGTSMATPHVAGAAALAWSHAPELGASTLRGLLSNTAKDLGASGRDKQFGYGLVDVAATLRASQTMQTVVSESFDDGLPAGWDLRGLWRVGSECGGGLSAPGALMFNRAATCTFETGRKVAGVATFEADLSAASVAALTFEQRWATESGRANYDRQFVQVLDPASGKWTTVASWSSSDADQPQWASYSVDLTPFVGGVAGIRFQFNSRDEVDNAHLGWLIDDVRVLVDELPPNRPPVAEFTTAVVGLDVGVDGSGSADPDGEIVSYAWDWGDGSPAGSGVTASHAYAAAGTYTITLTVTDDEGATGSVSQTVSVEEWEVLFAQDFDGASTAGWSFSGLARVGSECGGGLSPPAALMFNRAATCTYDTGKRANGVASFALDLTGRSVAVLSFEQRWKTEGAGRGSYDRQLVQVVDLGTGKTVTVASWNSSQPNQPDWGQHKVDLTPYVGRVVSIRFRFDTMDQVDNAHVGWLIDNVEITGN